MSRNKTTAGLAAITAAALAACSGPGADPAPDWTVGAKEPAILVPADTALERLLRIADEQWEGVGVRPDAVVIAPSGSDGTPVLWSSRAELTSLSQRDSAGMVYGGGEMVFIAEDLSDSNRILVTVHELGHILALERKHLNCEDDPELGVLCPTTLTGLLTHEDVAWICNSAAQPCIEGWGGEQ